MATQAVGYPNQLGTDSRFAQSVSGVGDQAQFGFGPGLSQ